MPQDVVKGNDCLRLECMGSIKQLQLNYMTLIVGQTNYMEVSCMFSLKVYNCVCQKDLRVLTLGFGHLLDLFSFRKNRQFLEFQTACLYGWNTHIHMLR